ncbi:MAG: endonuclease [Micromonosporaceae bacterium]|nr:endonuclease [Micromonosporaceae bacterium]
MSTRLATARVLLAPASAAALLLSLVAVPPAAAQESPPAVVVSQVYGGGGNSGALYTHDFVELFHSGSLPVSLDGWSVQYASAAGSTWLVTPLSGSLAPGQHFLVRQAAGAGGSQPLPEPDATGSTAMAAGSGKVALVATTTPLTGTCPAGAAVDFVGYGSGASCFEGSGPAPTLSNPVAAVRLDGGCRDTDDNPADFGTANPPTPRNTATPATPCDGGDPGEPPVTVTCPTSPVPGFDVSTTETYPAHRDLTATAAGATVTGLAVAVNPVPAEGTIAVIDVVPAPGPGGTATGTLAISDDVTAGSYQATVTATATGGEEGTCTAAIEVLPLVPVGAAQGAIADGQTDFTSPLLGQRVAVRAVVTQLTREGNGNRGFFLQERADRTDGDPRSSDGSFVFNGDFTTLRTEAEGPAREQVGNDWPVTVGDEIVLRGQVGQFFGMTQFSGSSSFVWEVTDTGLDIEDTVAVAEIDPPDDAGDSLRYHRRQLGMQLAVPAGSLVVGGRDVFAGTDAEVWAIRGDHPVATRPDPYARRVFRDVHPLDNQPQTGFDDGNGYRFVLGSFGVKGTTGDPDAVLAPAKTFDTITATNRGGVYLSFGKYTVNVVDQLALDTGGPDPAGNAPVPAADRERELSIATYNVENLYDFRDSPSSGCDFAGNPGCFADGESVTPPFDFVPGSDAEHQARLQRMAQQIRLDLHSPDILLAQETEAQDVCRVSPQWTPETGPGLGADRLDCDLTNPGAGNTGTDGRPDSLHELALVIAEQGGPAYDVAADLDSGDLRGITTGYLYRTDRVVLPAADPAHPVLGSDPQVDYPGTPLPFNADVSNPKSLNAALPDDVAETCAGSGPTACDGLNVFSRPAQVAQFRVWRAGIGTSTWTDLYLVDNHLSSGPDNRVRQRTEQAVYNARIADALLAAEPDARILVGGDLNVFPRPDDPYPPGTPIPGIGVGPSDQLRQLYESPLTNLHDALLAGAPAATYSFGFQGQAQTLDHLWTSPSLRAVVVDVHSAKINVDWPADAAGQPPGYGRFGVSDHDPQVVRLAATPTFPAVRALIDHLLATGDLSTPAARTVLALLATAERLQDRGLTTPADTVLAAAVVALQAFARFGLVTPEAAAGLSAEIGLLRSR